jgi:hypothetical protein
MSELLQRFAAKVLSKVDVTLSPNEIRWQAVFVEQVKACFATGELINPGSRDVEKLATDLYRELDSKAAWEVTMALKALSQCLLATADARRLRLRGDVLAARVYETTANENYNKLPEVFRWQTRS